MNSFSQMLFGNSSASMSEWNDLKKAQEIQDKMEREFNAEVDKDEADYRNFLQEKIIFNQEKDEFIKLAREKNEERRISIQSRKDDLKVKKNAAKSLTSIDVKAQLTEQIEYGDFISKCLNIENSFEILNVDESDLSETAFKKMQESYYVDKKAFEDERMTFKAKFAKIQRESDDLDEKIAVMNAAFEPLVKHRNGL